MRKLLKFQFQEKPQFHICSDLVQRMLTTICTILFGFIREVMSWPEPNIWSSIEVGDGRIFLALSFGKVPGLDLLSHSAITRLSSGPIALEEKYSPPRGGYSLTTQNPVTPLNSQIRGGKPHSSKYLKRQEKRWQCPVDSHFLNVLLKWHLSEYYATLKCLHTTRFNSREENGKPFDSIMVNPYKNCMYN